MTVVKVVAADPPKKCVPAVISWRWFSNRRPRGRGQG